MRKSLFLVALFLIATLSFNGVAAQNIAQGVRVVVIDAGHWAEVSGSSLQRRL